MSIVIKDGLVGYDDWFAPSRSAVRFLAPEHTVLLSKLSNNDVREPLNNYVHNLASYLSSMLPEFLISYPGK